MRNNISIKKRIPTRQGMKTYECVASATSNGVYVKGWKNGDILSYPTQQQEEYSPVHYLRNIEMGRERFLKNTIVRNAPRFRTNPNDFPVVNVDLYNGVQW